MPQFRVRTGNYTNTEPIPVEADGFTVDDNGQLKFTRDRETVAVFADGTWANVLREDED